MKNFVKEGQKLPLYGVGPYIVYGMAGVTIIGIILFNYVFKTGRLNAPWTICFRILGGVFVLLGLVIWFIGALRSGMGENITDNKLKTDGIYAWVRNPIYCGWWFLITGISLMWVNVWVLITIPINWLIMTISLKNTEEKWLTDLYGDEYEAYKKRVNRCIPCFPRRNG